MTNQSIQQDQHDHHHTTSSTTSSSSIVTRTVIGGPHTRLPRFVESLLSWSLCLSCLSVSGYHYCVSTYIRPLWSRLSPNNNYYHHHRRLLANDCHTASSTSSSTSGSSSRSSTATTTPPPMMVWIPLTTHSQQEMESKTSMERYHQLCLFLSKVYNINLKTALFVDRGSSRDRLLDNDDHTATTTGEQLIEILKSDTIARRLASLVMMGKWGGKSYHRRCSFMNQQSFDINGYVDALMLGENDEEHDKDFPEFVRFLMASWTKLLEFFPLSNSTSTKQEEEVEENCDFEISLVVPSYGETNVFLKGQVTKWYNHCKDPSKVEIIIVHAGGRQSEDGQEEEKEEDLLFVWGGNMDNCGVNDGVDGCQGSTNDYNIITRTKASWGCVRVLKYGGGGGRGPCLNYGARAARGRILTFCHLDTTLPDEWDDKVRNALRYKNVANDTMDRSTVLANACAFGFGIDTSKDGLGGGPYPPGIRAVETTANIRTQLFALPYGDQALSLSRAMFDFLGGFPDQCLMEDYELVVLLRKRVALFKSSSSSSLFGHQEVLKIVPGKPALCSPRRWQKFGVLYVTFMNSKFVNKYCGGLGPDQLYKMYYGSDPPKRESKLSPWEEELHKILSEN